MSFLQTLSFHCFRWLKEKNSTWKSLTIIQVRVNGLYLVLQPSLFQPDKNPHSKSQLDGFVCRWWNNYNTTIHYNRLKLWIFIGTLEPDIIHELHGVIFYTVTPEKHLFECLHIKDYVMYVMNITNTYLSCSNVFSVFDSIWCVQALLHHLQLLQRNVMCCSQCSYKTRCTWYMFIDSYLFYLYLL